MAKKKVKKAAAKKPEKKPGKIGRPKVDVDAKKICLPASVPVLVSDAVRLRALGDRVSPSAVVENALRKHLRDDIKQLGGVSAAKRRQRIERETEKAEARE